MLPEARQQRCTVHLMRNVFTRVPRHQKRLVRELVKVLHAESFDAAKRNLNRFRMQFATQFPEAVACLERGFADATAYYAFPAPVSIMRWEFRCSRKWWSGLAFHRP